MGLLGHIKDIHCTDMIGAMHVTKEKMHLAYTEHRAGEITESHWSWKASRGVMLLVRLEGCWAEGRAHVKTGMENELYNSHT